MAVDFNYIKSVYKQQIDSLIAPTGLSTPCSLNFSKASLPCPNCLYNQSLKKSANIYKANGPLPFEEGQICPYCSGVGIKSEHKTIEINMCILWDYKSWVIKPINIENPNGYIQTIADGKDLQNIMNAENMAVGFGGPINYPLFQLDSEPNPAGLGDFIYLICQWKKMRK